MMRGEACSGVRMECTRNREPSLRQSAHSGPIGPALLSPASECPAPESYHPIAKYAESAQVFRDRVVFEVTLYDRLEPFPRLRGLIMHTRSQLLLDFLQLGCHALGDRLALEGEFLILGLPADMREAQEAERFGLPSPLFFRLSSANRPNSIRRVLSGCSSNPNFCSRSVRCSRKRSASV